MGIRITENSKVPFKPGDVAIRKIAGSYAIQRYDTGAWTMGSVTSLEAVQAFLKENKLVRIYTLSDDKTEGIYR